MRVRKPDGAKKAAAAAFFVFALMLACVIVSNIAAHGARQAQVYTPYPQSAYMVTDADLQLPELPTGCEATAGATLLRLNGVLASKRDVADAMPKSSSDYVNAFWGDPYTVNGWAIMAPGMRGTMQGFLPAGYRCEDLTGTTLDNLPVPCQVWVTMALDEPYAVDSRNGYKLMVNTHCMIILGIGEEAVHVIDPLEGDESYPRGKFESRYNSCGRQAIYIERI